VLDQQISKSFEENFGIEGITFSNMEQVYSPLLSGFGQMHETRQHLLKNGMSK
jgi:hypothetical protein